MPPLPFTTLEAGLAGTTTAVIPIAFGTQVGMSPLCAGDARRRMVLRGWQAKLLVATRASLLASSEQIARILEIPRDANRLTIDNQNAHVYFSSFCAGRGTNNCMYIG